MDGDNDGQSSRVPNAANSLPYVPTHLRPTPRRKLPIYSTYPHNSDHFSLRDSHRPVINPFSQSNVYAATPFSNLRPQNSSQLPQNPAYAGPSFLPTFGFAPNPVRQRPPFARGGSGPVGVPYAIRPGVFPAQGMVATNATPHWNMILASQHRR